MINTVDAQRFAVFFKGKSNTYVRNCLPKEAPEKGQKLKTRILTVEGTVDADLLLRHLNGDFGVGICPVNADGKCFFGVLDIDFYGSSVNRVLTFIKEYQLPLLPFRSKSGGLHVYLMLAKSVSAKSMREILSQISYYFCLENLYGKGKVEIFPKQERAAGFGSAITLPYFNAENPYTYLLDLDGNKVSFQEACTYIKQHLTALEEVKEALSKLPYNDAPPCIQRILISEAVGADDSGRNNFLFSFAVYAKKKYSAGFEDYVREVNDRFECPLDDNVVEQLISSVSKNEYVYKCGDIPCNGFCDKPSCRKREFGLGRDRGGHFTGVDYGQLFRYMAAEPYYVWKLRLQGQEQWKDVIFKNEGDLLDQRNFAKMCVRYLNNAPMQVKSNDWNAILNTVLPNVKNIEVKSETDTSETALLRNAFLSYLANKMAHNDRPYQIHVGLCVRQKAVVDGKLVYKYYFTHQGFTDYLRNQKISFDSSLLRETLKSFGAAEDVLIYTNAVGAERKCSCWSKLEDESINEVYAGAMEVEEGDRAITGAQSVSEVSNKDEEKDAKKPKAYTDEDMKNAESMF